MSRSPTEAAISMMRIETSKRRQRHSFRCGSAWANDGAYRRRGSGHHGTALPSFARG